MMKKVMAALLVVMMVLALAACGSGSDSSSSNDSYSGGGNNSGQTCKFKQDGKYVCDSPCKSGSNFCSYHDAYLNDAYDSFVNGSW